MIAPRGTGRRTSLSVRVAVCVVASGVVQLDCAQATGYLAGVPLDSLTATRDRPLFVPGRRPAAAPAVPAVPDGGLPAPPPPVAPADPDPGLILLGIVRSPAGNAAVVEDKADHTSVSLRLGDGRRGWIVRSIGTDSVSLAKDEKAAILTYPRQDSSTPVAAPGQAIQQ